MNLVVRVTGACNQPSEVTMVSINGHIEAHYRKYFFAQHIDINDLFLTPWNCLIIVPHKS